MSKILEDIQKNQIAIFLFVFKSTDPVKTAASVISLAAVFMCCSSFSPAAAVGQFIASQDFIPRYTVGSLHPSILATRGTAPFMRKIFLSLSMRSMFVRSSMEKHQMIFAA